MQLPPKPDSEIVIDLLDSATGRPQQSWRFAPDSRIQIGRARENDVVLANPYVSRAHAYVEKTPSGWAAISISSQQLVASGRKVQTLELYSGTIFSLGPSGCSLRFRVESHEVAPEKRDFDYAGTLAFEPVEQPQLKLDLTQLSQEVTAITEGDFYKALAKNVEQLRRARQPPE